MPSIRGMQTVRDRPLTTTTTTQRWAVYWAPETTHPLWSAGCRWLGRDGREPRLLPGGASGPSGWLAEAQRYGFHATLKAPLQLRAGERPRDFLQAVHELALSHVAFELPPLQVRLLGDFLALRPQVEPHAEHPLRRLADACVRQLDAWRAPPTAAEHQRRLAALGDDGQLMDLTLLWGYPHVLSRWRFHLTLTQRLPADAALRAQLQRQAQLHFSAALAPPLRCESICVFVEPEPGAPFELRHRFKLREPLST